MRTDLSADLQLALEMADIADAVSLPRFRAADLVVATKPDLTPVTEADRGVEEALRERLTKARPNDAVLGEEYGGSVAAAGRQWVIDPIDATMNFVRGVPVWATLIALVEDGTAILSVASAPALGIRWWAVHGQGAFRRDAQGTQRLQVSQVVQLCDASFSFSDEYGWEPEVLADLMSASWRARAYGDFWSHLLVAEGAVDVAAEPALSIWDVAALIPIVVEAGGQIVGFDGTPALLAGSAVTTNGRLTAEVLAMIGRAKG